MQLGPNNIKPVYPLLDDIYVQKIWDEISINQNNQAIPSQRTQLIGFRPGLRGTEINGKWQLLIGVNSDFDVVNGMIGNPRSGIWFRQFRLEFIVDEGVEPFNMYSSKERRFKKSAYVPQKDGKRLIDLLSGSSEWDIGINYVYTEQKPDYGRSIGITSDSGSSPDSFAIFTRITGSLADNISGTLVPYYYLNNEFGTPYIPLSSGSSISPFFAALTIEEATKSRQLINDILHQRPTIASSNTIQDTLNRLALVQSTTDAVLSKLN